MKKLFYDIEVFEKMNLVGLLDEDGKGYVIVNAPNLPSNVFEVDGVQIYLNVGKVRERANESLLNGDYVFVGFNNKAYDNFLIEDILQNRPTNYIKLKSDSVIKKRPSQFIDFLNLDTKEQMQPGFSLKKFESMSGMAVEESSIPFDYKDVFTIEQILEVCHYNIQDLRATIKLYKTRKDYFDGKELLVKEYSTSKTSINYSNGSTAASYLMGRDKLENFEPEDPDIYGVPTGVKLFLENALKVSPEISHLKTKAEREKVMRKEWTSLVMEDHGMVYTWGFGGLHSAKGRIETNKRGTKKIVYDVVDETDVQQWDSGSHFPNIMLRDNLLGQVTNKFRNLVKERLKNKALGNPLAGTQKIIINSVYGLLRLQSSKLYNPKSAIRVNVSGMVAIYNLANHLDLVGNVYQVNTDGIAFKPYPDVTQETLDNIKQRWEDEFKLQLEVSSFKRLIQRDVNNYIAVKQNDKLKLKGGAVGQANGVDVTKASKPTIIDHMLVEKLVYDRPFITTVQEGEFRDYCFTLKSMKSSTQTGKMVDENGKVFDNEVNRTYATKSGGKVLKEKVGELENAKFPDTPEQMSIANYELPKEPPADLDYSYYIELAEKKLESWKKVL
ncbi:DNA polymerase [Leuconostoc phage phiLNTR3]|uniref:Putative DNA polymerase n=1 Tax=Leuconostoc phage phiLNTR3 TaxID=1262521 RepID=A0A059PAS1_9CAUD|nr:DNA polymerase [Leuconostoc phage phiLNTR3]AFY98500.1 putative DNA polymerase [Leuconostoc phage phiLNTR3]